MIYAHTNQPRGICSYSFLVFALLISGCENKGRDDAEAVALIKKHVTPGNMAIEADDDGVEYIVKLQLHDKNGSILLPHLSGLPMLSELGVRIKDITSEQIKLIAQLKSLKSLGIYCGDDDVEYLKEMTNLESLQLTSPEITDQALKYLSGLKNLNELELFKTQVHGSGLAYLEGFDQLEWLYMTDTQLDDSAIPHIVANFPKLKRFYFDNTNVTRKGLLQLAELHWLLDIAVPNKLFQNPEDPNAEKAIWKEFCLEYIAAYKESKRKARVAGEDVPPDHQYPFGSVEHW